MTPSIRKARARASTSWALGRTPSKVLAELWAVSPSRARHKRLAGEDCVNDSCALVTHPEVDGAAIVLAHLESLERRYLEEAKAGPVALKAKLDQLVSREEHFAEARQNQALQDGGAGTNEACLEHAQRLIEIVAIRRVLGLEDEG